MWVKEQSKISSAIESFINVFIGYIIALGSQIIILPMFDIHLGVGENVELAAYFSAISLVRTYVVRRWFNDRLHIAALKLAGDING